MLKGKKIVLGVTGGIAAYKSGELIRSFIKKGALVNVIMTKNAMEFITPLTLQTLSGNPVSSDMFISPEPFDIAHISLAGSADILVIAPATANVIGKIAAGIADDLLTTTVMATKCPVMICPAMNVNMLNNALVQDNMRKLTSLGYYLLSPGVGELACKDEGPGRLPETAEIIEEAQSILTKKDLKNERIVVTAGPTQEPLDPVRFITNHSSGKMGYALAIVAKRRGADVTLISGPTSLAVPKGVKFISVSNACDMRDAVMAHHQEATAIIMAAAVADYRPSTRSKEKIKKTADSFDLTLARNPDIIAELGSIKKERFLIGFAMETENLVENAKAKLAKKNMDFIVANAITKEGAGFGCDTNIVTIIGKNWEVEELPQMDKLDVADRILDKMRESRKSNS